MTTSSCFAITTKTLVPNGVYYNDPTLTDKRRITYQDMKNIVAPLNLVEDVEQKTVNIPANIINFNSYYDDSGNLIAEGNPTNNIASLTVNAKDSNMLTLNCPKWVLRSTTITALNNKLTPVAKLIPE